MSVGGRRDSDRMIVGFMTTYTSTKPSYECLVVVRHESHSLFTYICYDNTYSFRVLDYATRSLC
jgi:hypothetical protein